MSLTELESEKRRLNKLCHFWLSKMNFDFKHSGHDYIIQMDLMFKRFDKASAEYQKASADYDKIYRKIERLKTSSNENY